MRLGPMKDFAFPQHFISTVLPCAQPTAVSSPFTLPTPLLHDLATLFEHEAAYANASDEKMRLFKISRELDRMVRVKTAYVRRKA
jgi:hypothetical protein